MTDAPPLDVLLPRSDRTPVRLEPRADEAELVALIDERPAERTQHTGPTLVVRANMITTLDGAATGPDHVTGSINGPADLRVFEALRVLADVVLVGAGTVRQERYNSLTLPEPLAATRRAHGREAPIELAVVTRSGDLPDPLLDADRPPLVVTTAANPRLDALRERVGTDRVVVAGDVEVDLVVTLRALVDRGLTNVLTEGGPSLLAELVARDLVDELFLTWSPVLTGGPAPRVLDGAPWLNPPREAALLHLLHADGVLLGRWGVRAPGRHESN